MLMARETKSRTAEEIGKTKIPDPVVVCTAFDKNRSALLTLALSYCLCCTVCVVLFVFPCYIYLLWYLLIGFVLSYYLCCGIGVVVLFVLSHRLFFRIFLCLCCRTNCATVLQLWSRSSCLCVPHVGAGCASVGTGCCWATRTVLKFEVFLPYTHVLNVASASY